MTHPRIGLVYRDFAAYDPGYCHVGLGINAQHTVRTLRRAGIHITAFPVHDAKDVRAVLGKHPELTHLVIEAPWMTTPDLGALLAAYPSVEFIVRTHSQIGFLQVEPRAIKLLREQLVLQESVTNLAIAANSRHLATFFRACLQRAVRLPAEPLRLRARAHQARRAPPPPLAADRLLRRPAPPQDHTTAAAAAMMAARQLGSDLEFWVSVHREEHGKGVLSSLRHMLSNVPWAKLVEHPWEPWAQFRRTVAHMDLCMQTSMTETFNIVTADATAEGVPSVVATRSNGRPSRGRPTSTTCRTWRGARRTCSRATRRPTKGASTSSATCTRAYACGASTSRRAPGSGFDNGAVWRKLDGLDASSLAFRRAEWWTASLSPGWPLRIGSPRRKAKPAPISGVSRFRR